METKRSILVTGMSGLIGSLAGHDLARDYRVRALNRRPVEGFETVQASVVDYAAIRTAFDGIDTVVHLAAYLGDDDRQQLQVNAIGSYNVFEAAREAGVRRVVFASSGEVMKGYENDEPIRSMTDARLEDIHEPLPTISHLDPIRPVKIYGAVKAFGEALSRVYHETHGISVLCIRLGRVTADDRPHDAREAAVYLSHRDAVQVVRRCVEAPDDVGFAIIYGVSDNFSRFRDIAHAGKVIGYVPVDGIKEWPLPEGWKP
jgi:nucleoside-diphosphate-sugar epimerase